MNLVDTIFWGCIFAVAYNYLGYPALLFLLAAFSQAKRDFTYLIRRENRRCSPRANYVPRVAILVSAHNEAAVIADKLENSLLLDYPPDRLEMWFGLDAPSDSTSEILKQASDHRVQVVEFQTRRGKLAVIADLAQRTAAEILVLTDANTMLDSRCIRNLVRHFMDSRVAAVSGEEVRTVARQSDPGGESVYWRYESAIKILESRLNCAQGGNGAALAIRRSLFKPKAGSIVEDFQIPLQLRFEGHRVIYDPEAIAMEEITPTLQAQFTRRIRIGAGNYQTLFRNPRYLNPLNGLLTFSFISHRVLRWLTPVCLLVAFACSAAMMSSGSFTVLFAMQCAFYAAALIGYALKRKNRQISFLSMPLHFCSMNLALVLGLYAYITGRQGATWSATPRTNPLRSSQGGVVEIDTVASVRPAA